MKTEIIVAATFVCDKCNKEKEQSGSNPDGSFDEPPKGWMLLQPPMGFPIHICPKCIRQAYMEGPNK